jgi:hypothetical protein
VWARRLEESASVAADLASRAGRLTLEPADKLLESELRRKVVGASGRSSGSRDDGRGRASGGGRSGAGAGAEESRTGDGVVDGAGVRVEEDTGVVALVEFGTDDAFGLLGSGTGDLNVLRMRVSFQVTCMLGRLG